MTTISMDYAQLRLVVVALFVAVGFFRGFAREVFTSVVLLFLNYLVVNPNLAQKILDYSNSILNLFKVIITNPSARTSAQGLVRAYSESPPPLSLNNSFTLFLILLLVLLVISYVIGGRALGDEKLTSLSRLLGGLLGFLNGTMIVALFKDYILGNFLKTGTAALSAQAAVPTTMALEVQNVPQQPLFREGFVLLLIGAVIVVILFLVLAEKFKIQLPFSRK